MSKLLVRQGDKFAVRTSTGTIECFEFIPLKRVTPRKRT